MDADLVSATFSTLDAGRSARKRLARAGFARNSVDIERQRNGFEVSISVRPDNWDRAEQALNRSQTVAELGDAAVLAGRYAGDNRWLTLALAGMAGFLLFSLTTRRAR